MSLNTSYMNLSIDVGCVDSASIGNVGLPSFTAVCNLPPDIYPSPGDKIHSYIDMYPQKNKKLALYRNKQKMSASRCSQVHTSSAYRAEPDFKQNPLR